MGKRPYKTARSIFKRVRTIVWRQLLGCSAATCDPGNHGALDATFSDRQAASQIARTDRHILRLKATALDDTGSCAIFDVYCPTHWPHATQVCRRAVLRNTANIEYLVSVRLRRPIITRHTPHRRRPAGHQAPVFTAHAHIHGWTPGFIGGLMAETTFLAIKRQSGFTIRLHL